MLFDGKTNAGWVRPSGSPGKFVPEDSALRTSGGDICTQGEYDNFELSVDYRYDAGGNSGIFLRTKKGVDPPWLNGMEVGIQDNGRAGNLYKNGDASVYDVKAPSKDKWTGPMKWNRIVVWLAGSKLEHWHNGEKVIDLDMSTSEWQSLVAASKFSKSPFPSNNWGKETKGQVCLQDHGAEHKIWFRNMKIRPITLAAALPAPTATPKGGSFKDSVRVVLDPAVTGAAVHYTTDGSAPTPASPKYAGPLVLKSSATVKAIAVRAGFPNSPVASEAYQFGPTGLAGQAAGTPSWDFRPGREAALALDWPGGRDWQVGIFDLSGRKVRTFAGSGSGPVLALKGLEAGVYRFRAAAGQDVLQGRFVLP
jgi:hypothetical protein